MKVDEIGWSMWHAWEINTYIVWWELLKEGDYLSVDGQIILKLMWKTWCDSRVGVWRGGGGGLSGLDTFGMWGSDSEHQAFSISVLYVQVNI
jgi:hypothetical protein